MEDGRELHLEESAGRNEEQHNRQIRVKIKESRLQMQCNQSKNK
jgi:hypothetical protein